MLNEFEMQALAKGLKRTHSALDPDEVIRRCENLHARILTRASRGFPKLLLQIGEACPDALFLLGNGNLEGPMTAVVGSRKASVYGAQAATAIGEILGRGGINVVSGMARGIDSCAHEGALSGGGATIAVLGCGVDVCYPPEARDLRERITENGLLVSEYPPGTEPRPYHFPERNRIISGLCRETIVVEARSGSGSIITASCAAEQNRDVYIVPGSIFEGEDSETLKLWEDGAIPLGRLSDVEKLCLLRVGPELRREELPDDVRWVMDHIGDFGATPEEIERASGRGMPEILAALVKAKTRGALVSSDNGKWYPKRSLQKQ